MIIVNVEQGSEAWHELRLGRVTGTRFKALMAGESTSTYKDLVTDLAGEIITQTGEETYNNAIMDRGKDLEPEARDLYSEMFGEVREVGMVLRDEEDPLHEWIGVSPDGLGDGGLEIKCPLRKTHINYIRKNKLPAEYRWQVQGQLYVTGLPYCDFMSYYPGMKPFIVRVFPDDADHNAITERLGITIERVNELIKLYNKYDFEND